MTEPQIWTAIGILAVALAGMITITTHSLVRSINMLSANFDTQFTSLRTEMVLRFEQVDRQFGQVDRRFEQVDQRFEQIDRRFERLEKQVDNLERDVQVISKRVFPE